MRMIFSLFLLLGATFAHAQMDFNLGSLSSNEKRNIQQITQADTVNVDTLAALEAALVTHWRVGSWTGCSRTCGGGTRTRTVTCPAGFECAGSKPSTSQSCNTNSCNWTVGGWGGCTKSCGGGYRYRSVTCPQGGCPSSTKPSTSSSCNTHTCTADWKVGSWGTCQRNGCSYVGYQNRSVTCPSGYTCPASKPKTSRSCSTSGCGGKERD